MNCKLSIIIVNWNVADLLLNSIQSIVQNAPTMEYEIIVVDNNSSDDSLSRLEAQFPFVKIIANKENLGFGKANNQGIEIAVGSYILLLNPDTIIIEDAIVKMVKILENHPEIGMIGPQLLDKDLNPLAGGAKLSRSLTSGVLLDLLNIELLPLIGPFLTKVLRYPYDLSRAGFVEVISGSAMMFRKSTIEEVGSFDERYFMAGEDVELCDRFWKKGLKVYYFPDAKIIHFNQSCTPLNPVDIFVNRFMSVAKYYELKDGRWTQFWFRFFTFLIFIPKLFMKACYAFLFNKENIFKTNFSIIRKLMKWRFIGEAEKFNVCQSP